MYARVIARQRTTFLGLRVVMKLLMNYKHLPNSLTSFSVTVFSSSGKSAACFRTSSDILVTFQSELMLSAGSNSFKTEFLTIK